jgi:hypothetical protein
MAGLHSARIHAVVAIFTMVLAIVVPFAAMTQVVARADTNSAVVAVVSGPNHMDYGACSKANVALAPCPQMNCQMAAIVENNFYIIVSKAVRYRPATVSPPVAWRTVPPVSPG